MWWIRGWVALLVLAITAPVVARPGFVLSYDAVWVPDQDLLPWMWGAAGAPPRSVPQDTVVAVLDDVVPGWVLWRVLLVGALLLAGLGAAHLVRERGRFEQAMAATMYLWSAWTAERLLIGHWGLLLGMGALPWVLAAAHAARQGVRGSWPPLVLWAAVGSLVPSAGALTAATALVVLAWPGPRAAGRVRAAAAVLAVQACWVVPALLDPGTTGAQEAEAFGLRAEGPLGPVLTALGTGGIWSGSVTPGSRETAWAALGLVVLLGLGVAGVRSVRTLPQGLLGPLVLLATAGLCWAVLTAFPAGLPAVTWVQSLPGGGLLRDAHKWLLPWSLLLSLAVAAGARRVRAHLPRDVLAPMAALMLVLPVVLLPDLAWGIGGRVAPVQYPASWSRVRSALEEHTGPGDVLSLPLSAFRAFGWNDRRTSLDPAPRFLPRTVVTDDRLVIGAPAAGGEPVVLPGDDARAAAAVQALSGPQPAVALRGLGIGYLLVATDQPGAPGSPAPDLVMAQARTVVESPGLALLHLDGPVAPTGPDHVPWLLLAWGASLGVILIALAGALHRALTRPMR